MSLAARQRHRQLDGRCFDTVDAVAIASTLSARRFVAVMSVEPGTIGQTETCPPSHFLAFVPFISAPSRHVKPVDVDVCTFGRDF